MSIYATPGQTFEAIFQSGQPGLAGQIGLAISDPTDGSQDVPRSTAGIVERPADSGIYVATRTAPATQDNYLLTWDVNQLSGQYATEELIVSSSPPPPIAAGATPTIAEVGNLLRARTKDKFGNELGTFNADTRPTENGVLNIILQAANDLAMRTGWDPIESTWPSIRWMTTLKAAMLVELSYFPEQVSDRNSPYEHLLALYTEGLDALGDMTSVVRPERGVVSVPIRGVGWVDPEPIL